MKSMKQNLFNTQAILVQLKKEIRDNIFIYRPFNKINKGVTMSKGYGQE
ncbi:hypothetical protein GCM10008983_07220 [Lentibacillus halophilus]|uniref:Uncharacterized protein n=1 Tax=Lentibacillus halophilus TaxID=295065 RepID=A0ABN0Z4Q6_9BACI